MFLFLLLTTVPNFDEAIVATSLTPAAQVLVEEAQELMNDNQYREAEKVLRKADKVQPDSALINRMLGDVNVKLNKPSVAKKFYKKAAELENN
ncbi:MAG: hypothetical protein KDC71_14800 [Acidobacteria bacterium]|nr:hypothetical protein [Acidobacteriota bacterium]